MRAPYVYRVHARAATNTLHHLVRTRHPLAAAGGESEGARRRLGSAGPGHLRCTSTSASTARVAAGQVAPSKAWFRVEHGGRRGDLDGLAFSCVQCGRCCRGPNAKVSVSVGEAEQLAGALGVSPEVFVRDYTDATAAASTAGGGGRTLRHTDASTCVLLDEASSTCTVHDSRPTACRAYPFTADALLSEFDWGAEATHCPGIQLGSAAGATPTDATARVPSDTIVTTMLESEYPFT